MSLFSDYLLLTIIWLFNHQIFTFIKLVCSEEPVDAGETKRQLVMLTPVTQVTPVYSDHSTQHQHWTSGALVQGVTLTGLSTAVS